MTILLSKKYQRIIQDNIKNSIRDGEKRKILNFKGKVK